MIQIFKSVYYTQKSFPPNFFTQSYLCLLYSNDYSTYRLEDGQNQK